VGNGGTIRKTTNGGTAWVTQTSGTTNELKSVHFPVDALTGYAVGYSGIILKTTDGGAFWFRQFPSTSNILNSAHFPTNALTGYVVGQGGIILKTTDGGSGVEETAESGGQKLEIRITATPNPFTSFSSVLGHERDRFTLYDVSGRRVGVYRGDRIGEGLKAGVYFVRAEGGGAKPVRVVKVR